MNNNKIASICAGVLLAFAAVFGLGQGGSGIGPISPSRINVTTLVTTGAFQGFTNSLGTAAFSNSVVFQPASANLTNWSLLSTGLFTSTNIFRDFTNSLGTAAYSNSVVFQSSSANLTNWSLVSTGSYTTTNTFRDFTNSLNSHVYAALPIEIGVAASDTTTALTAGTNKSYFRAPRAFTITSVRATVGTAQSSGSILTVDINEEGTTILSTKLTIDNTETNSQTAATPSVISDTSIADDALITVDIDQVGAGDAKWLIIWLIGTRQ